jgi:hypothetical protein
MAFDAGSLRGRIPVPKGHSKILAWGLFLLGAIWLFDCYDGRGRPAAWPASTIFPW